MPLLEIPYPGIDPVLIHIGSLQIKWYGLLFVAGFLVGNWLLQRLSKEGRLKTDKDGVSDLLVVIMIGIILGGRLGYVCFYDLPKFVAEPLEVFKIWKGGLSFHGGLIGAFCAVVFFTRRRMIPLMNVMDACAASAGPGIFFVRCANFINGELWGKPTDVPWAMVFPRADTQPRHPSQLYEGLLEGVLLFLILWTCRNRAFFKPNGRLAGCFLTGYAAIRFLVEFVREPDAHLGPVLGPFSMGQVLSAGMFAFGLATLWLVGRGGSRVSVDTI
jgi:phosphatidylglycerol:prolipoprotein diacylglycerol transferase